MARDLRARALFGPRADSAGTQASIKARAAASEGGETDILGIVGRLVGTGIGAFAGPGGAMLGNQIGGAAGDLATDVGFAAQGKAKPQQMAGQDFGNLQGTALGSVLQAAGAAEGAAEVPAAAAPLPPVPDVQLQPSQLFQPGGQSSLLAQLLAGQFGRA